ncbi:MAM and LDL-receptor class A domain-containing protein 1-like [Polyodon spathula]|uniref:MAM and LDL-receptor class A domain-containing protein 1-like n=1 Tax=Polyodon spathula TaxID=7913 RepID=UPI001B7EB7DB|nr:MAM and LDL-receptor class A domain-containing protein 1-like [Polyodon spathula]
MNESNDDILQINGDGKNTDSHLLLEKPLRKSQRDVVQLGTSAATPVSASGKETTGTASTTLVSASPASSTLVSQASSQADLSVHTSTRYDQTTLQASEVTQSLPPTPSPRPASLFCDFELDLCGWENCRSGDFNWLLRRERPAEFETQTLPDGHANCRNFAGQYLYMEAVYPRESGQTAVLISPAFKGPKCLSFWYSLLGDGVEAIAVYVQYVSSPDSWHKLWSASGAMPRKWYFQQLDLFVKAEEEYQILLEGTIRNNYCGDAAIDDLSVSETLCMPLQKRIHRRRELPATPAPEGSPSVSIAPVLPPPEVLETLFCDFEKGLCGWSQCTSDEFDWELHQERLPPLLSAMQPDSLGRCHNLEGQYLYMEAVYPRESGQTAVLISPAFKGPKCLSFWYSLLGDGVEAIAVYVQYVSSPDSWHKLWSASGAMPRKWYFQQLDLFVKAEEEYQILLEGTIHNNYCGDAAIDDLSVSETLCMPFQKRLHRRRELPATPAPEGSPSVSIAPVLPPPEVLETLFCDFEKGLCGWSQCTSDEFDWELHQERLPPLLGAMQPDSLGKCRNLEGQYLYMEAAYPRESGQTAVLISPAFKGPKCLSFWYSLFGDGVGSLNVYVQYVSTAGIWHKLWSVSGNKSRKWHLAELELFVDPNETFQMILQGTIGNLCGDVAVDDVFVTGHHCSKEQHAPCWKD